MFRDWQCLGCGCGAYPRGARFCGAGDVELGLRRRPRPPRRHGDATGGARPCRAIVEATSLPVSADLEKGFSDAPDGVAETIRLAAATGLVGCTIEDFSGDPQKPLFDFNHAKVRIEAAVGAARRLPFPFTLTARAEGFLRGNPDLDDTIKRLQAFEAAGADVLMAPGLPDLATVRTVCAALSRPFSFMAGIKGRSFSTAELAHAGVKRISLATSLYRAAMSGLVNAAREVKEQGTFGYVEAMIATPEFDSFMRGPLP